MARHRDNPLLPFGTIYLTGAREPALDAACGHNRFAASSHDEQIPIGILVQPLTEAYLDDGADFYTCVGVDNGCFTERGQRRFRLDAYLRLIDRALETFGDFMLFATARDVAFEWEATLRLSLPMLPKIRALGAPAALVVQDGATPANIPWDDLDCIFIGGSTEWKLSATAAQITEAAVRRQKWVHMGRVNSLLRMRIAQDFGCRSADGTYLLHEGAAGVEAVISWARDSWKRDPQRPLFRAAGR